jgi:AbrB family looped-hinge helix DNA binding protein
MRTTIDKAGRVVVPKPMRDELGLTPGLELDLQVVDGHLELAIPSRVHLQEGPHGIRFAADTNERLNVQQLRDLIERGRR